MGSILIVEDDRDIRETVAELLVEEGFEVREAEHGLRALQVLDEMEPAKPCLVLLDLMMPVMSGPEFLRVLDEQHRLAQFPVVIVSAYAANAEELPVQRVLRKPPSISALLQLVHEFCAC